MNVKQEQPVGINPPVDYSAALLWVDGDRTLLTELVEIFLEDCPQRLHELEQAVTEMVACFGAMRIDERRTPRTVDSKPTSTALK